MLRLLKKHWLAFLILFLLVGRVVSYAQTDTQTSSIEPTNLFQQIKDNYNKQTNPNSPPNLFKTIAGDKNNDHFLEAVSEGLLATIIPLEEAEEGQSSTSLLPLTSRTIAALYQTPPASGINYIADLKDKFFNLGGKTAYAQGVGFTGLQPILPIWKAFRNATYSVFAILFIILGVLIIFRVKISPQAVITIQNALPQAIITLLLITFSYAIAGLLIDFLYILLGLGINILKIGGVTPTFLGTQPTLKALNNMGYTALTPGFLIGFQGADQLGAAIGYMIFSLAGGVIPPLAFMSGVAGSIAGAVIFILIWAIIAFVAMIKLLIALIKTYINIILSIIFAPLQLMLGAFPGSKAGFGSWVKGLFANIMVFPAVALILIIATFIIQNVGYSSMWIPPFIGPPLTPLSGFVASAFIQSIIGLGMILLLPKIPDIIRGALGIKDQGFAQAIGEAFGPVKVVSTAATQAGATVASQRYEKAMATPGGPSATETGAHIMANILRVFGKVK